jgi:hypothetical protein
MILSGGTLTSLNAKATATGWAIAGGTFNATAYVNYTSTGDLLTLTGDATASFGSGRTLSLILGTSSVAATTSTVAIPTTTGMVLSSGTLTSLNARATATGWAIAGGTFNATAYVNYTSTGDLFTLTGDATASFGSGKTLSLVLGTSSVAATTSSVAIPSTTGMVLSSGTLTSLNAKGTASNWSIAGTTLSATALVTYAAATNSAVEKMTVTGSGRFTQTDWGTINVKMGTAATTSPANPGTAGLVLSAGKVSALDMTVDSNLTTGGLTFSTVGMRLVYDEPTAKYSLSGLSSFS